MAEPHGRLDEAKQALVEANLGIAHYAGLKHWGRTRLKDDCDDLTSIAMVALCCAATKYDPSIGKFSAYAFRTCKDWVTNELRDGGIIKTPKKLRTKGCEDRPYFADRARVRTRGRFRPIEAVESAMIAPEAAYDRLDAKEATEMIDRLPGLQGTIMRGLLAGETVTGIATAQGLERQKVSNIKAQAIRTLQTRFGVFD